MSYYVKKYHRYRYICNEGNAVDDNNDVDKENEDNGCVVSLPGGKPSANNEQDNYDKDGDDNNSNINDVSNLSYDEGGDNEQGQSK